MDNIVRGQMGIVESFNFRFSDEEKKFIDDLREAGLAYSITEHALNYGTWIQKNCLVSRNGFRLEPSLKEEISNEKAYELYLESLKNK